MFNVKQLAEDSGSDFNLHLSEDEKTLFVDENNIKNLLKALKEKHKFEMLIDITAIDYIDFLEVAYHVMRLEDAEVIGIKVKVPVTVPKVPSIIDIWKTADVLEREIFDLMGIIFEGHGTLKRILCNDDFIGNPLRKSYKLDIPSRYTL